MLLSSQHFGRTEGQVVEVLVRWWGAGVSPFSICPMKPLAKAHTQQKQRRRDSSHTRWIAIRSDINVSDVCGSAREVHVPLHSFGLCGDVVLLSLSETRFQQGLNLLLTRSQTVLWGETGRLATMTTTYWVFWSDIRKVEHLQGRFWWLVRGSWWGSETRGNCHCFWGTTPALLLQRCRPRSWMEGLRWSWHLKISNVPWLELRKFSKKPPKCKWPKD